MTHAFSHLALLLLAAHVLGWLFQRVKQPALVGHMVAGVVLGPSLLAYVTPNIVLASAADVALFFVVLAAGLELNVKDISALLSGRGVLMLLPGLLIPASMASLLVWMAHLDATAAIVTVLCVTVTALPVALQILRAFGLLDTAMARVAIVCAMLSDIVVLMVLGVLIEFTKQDDGVAVMVAAIALLKLVALIALVFAAHLLCEFLAARHGPKLNGNSRRLHTAWSGVLAATLVSGLGLASAKLGLHFAIGAFFGAMMITRDLMGDPHFERFQKGVSLVVVAIFGPLFLAFQGVKFELQSLTSYGFIAALLLVTVFSKLTAGYVVGRAKRMSMHDSIGVGIVMNAGGVMEMVVASIAYRAYLVDAQMYSALLLIGLVTSMLTPLFLMRWKRI